MSRPGSRAVIVWALLCLAAAAIAARTTYTTDLSAFLPRAPTSTQKLLVEQLREGPAARLIIAAIEGANAGARADISTAMARTLRADPAFTVISNGDAAGLERDRHFLFENRYLLSDAVDAAHFTAAGLHASIAASIDALASPAGPLIKPLFAQDPTGELLSILDAAGASPPPHTTSGVWSSRDGARALIVLQTRARGSDTDAQERACGRVRAAFATAAAAQPADVRGGVKLLMSGPPVFAVASRSLIKGEVLRLSAVSSVLIALLLLSIYRSFPALVLALVPVASGALAGVAAVALGFGAVHGITLGFGVTLIGEAVDYSVYLFVQRAPDWRRTLWPTLRLGVLTSIAGFAALLPSGFQGLAQLGLYSIAGLIAAALVTRFVLPALLPRDFAIRDLSAAGSALARVVGRLRPLRALLLGVAILAAASLCLHRGALFSHDITDLSPIPVADQDLDERLRAELGAPDVRFMVVVSAPGEQAVLDKVQSLSQRLELLVDAGVIGGFESPARYLPGLAVQRARLASLPESGELRARLAQALQGLPVSAGALDPFLHDVEQARRRGVLSRAALEDTSFAAATDALLVRSEGGWAALLPIAAVGSGDLPDAAVAQVRTALAAGTEGAGFLDLKGEADRLYAGYLRQAVQLALAGFAAILVLLAFALRSPGRIVRVLAPLALSVLGVAALLVTFGQELGILHVVGMLLIVAVGSNYALFFDRNSTSAPHGSESLTLASLLVANLATVVAFGVLATSRVPVLADLGMTVAPGTLLALLFSAMLSRPASAPSGIPAGA